MPKCLILQEDTFDLQEIEELICRANDQGRTIPVELKPDSWGILNGKLVAVDYG